MGIFYDVQGQLTPQSVELLQSLMHVIITCKYEKDRIKNSMEKVATPFFHYKSMETFSDAQGQLTPQSVVRSG